MGKGGGELERAISVIPQPSSKQTTEDREERQGIASRGRALVERYVELDYGVDPNDAVSWAITDLLHLGFEEGHWPYELLARSVTAFESERGDGGLGPLSASEIDEVCEELRFHLERRPR